MTEVVKKKWKDYKWLVGLLPVFVLVLIVFLAEKRNIDAFGVDDDFSRMFLLFGIMLLGGVTGAYILLFFRSKKGSGRRFRLEYTFLVVGCVLGIMYNTLVPPMAAPDEDFHHAVARAVAGELMGQHPEERGIMLVPDGEEDPGLENKDISRAYYDRFLGWMGEKGSADLSSWHYEGYWDNDKYYRFFYFPGGLGIAVGRLFHLSYPMCLWIGRLFGFLLFLLAGFYALRKIPIGKEILFLVLLLPITLQQAASFSADGVMISLSFILLGGTLSLSVADKWKAVQWVDLVIVLVTGVLLGKAKFGACFPICLLILLIVFGQWKKNRKRSCLALGVFFVTLVFGLLFGLYSMATDSRTLTPGLGGNANYTVSDLIAEPYLVFMILANTIMHGSDSYWIQMMGASLGWFTIQVPMFLILLFLPLFLITILPDEGEIVLPFNMRVILFLSGFFGIGMSCAGVLLDWTPYGTKAIAGIQGRYFIPYLPLFLLAFMPKRIRYRNGELIRRAAVMAGIVLEAVIVLTLMYGARVI